MLRISRLIHFNYQKPVLGACINILMFNWSIIQSSLPWPGRIMSLLHILISVVANLVYGVDVCGDNGGSVMVHTKKVGRVYKHK